MAARAYAEPIDEAVPTEQDKSLAGKSSELIARHLDHVVSIRALGERAEKAELPAAALRPLLELLRHMAQGTPVTLVPLPAMLTTQEAADLLRVSRPHFIKMLDTGKIPYKKVGTHRRIEHSAVVKYRRKRDIAREKAMEELSSLAQGYDMDR